MSINILIHGIGSALQLLHQKNNFMASVIDLERKIKSYALSQFKNYKRNQMPEEVITLVLIRANNSQYFWFQYFVKYYDLFTTIERALLKARSYSVALHCRWLRDRRGCSMTRVYEILKREMIYNKIMLDESILSMANRSAFIESIEQLEVGDESNYIYK